jgi:hypothetical protein
MDQALEADIASSQCTIGRRPYRSDRRIDPKAINTIPLFPVERSTGGEIITSRMRMSQVIVNSYYAQLPYGVP